MTERTTTKPETLTLGTGEAARLLGLSKPTVIKLCKSGSIPAFNLGGRWRISAAGLEAWVDVATQRKTIE